MNETIVNAQIESTMIGYEGHGILSLMIHVSYDGGSASQGYGGYRVDGKDGFLAESIMGFLRVTDKEQWENVKGTLVRVKKDGNFGKITAIGHIMKDEWFSLQELSLAHKS